MDADTLFALAKYIEATSVIDLVKISVFLYLAINIKSLGHGAIQLAEDYIKIHANDKKPLKVTHAVTASDLDLTQLMLESECDRALIFQYHNGDHTLSGIDFLKMTCTHESLRPGIKTNILLKERLCNIPVTAYPYLTDLIIDSPITVIEDISSLKNNSTSVYNEFSLHKAKSIIVCRLTDIHDNISGMLVLEYLKKKFNGSEDIISKIESAAIKISTRLEGIQ